GTHTVAPSAGHELFAHNYRRRHLRNVVWLGITVKTLSERGIRERLQPARAAVGRATKLNPKGCSEHLNKKPPNSPRAGPAGQHPATAIPEGVNRPQSDL